MSLIVSIFAAPCSLCHNSLSLLPRLVYVATPLYLYTLHVAPPLPSLPLSLRGELPGQDDLQPDDGRASRLEDIRRHEEPGSAEVQSEPAGAPPAQPDPRTGQLPTCQTLEQVSCPPARLSNRSAAHLPDPRTGQLPTCQTLEQVSCPPARLSNRSAAHLPDPRTGQLPTSQTLEQVSCPPARPSNRSAAHLPDPRTGQLPTSQTLK